MLEIFQQTKSRQSVDTQNGGYWYIIFLINLPSMGACFLKHVSSFQNVEFCFLTFFHKEIIPSRGQILFSFFLRCECHGMSLVFLNQVILGCSWHCGLRSLVLTPPFIGKSYIKQTRLAGRKTFLISNSNPRKEPL